MTLMFYLFPLILYDIVIWYVQNFTIKKNTLKNMYWIEVDRQQYTKIDYWYQLLISQTRLAGGCQRHTRHLTTTDIVCIFLS